MEKLVSHHWKYYTETLCLLRRVKVIVAEIQDQPCAEWTMAGSKQTVFLADYLNVVHTPFSFKIPKLNQVYTEVTAIKKLVK